MSHASEVAQAPDEMIAIRGENSHAIYIGLGTKITVTWMGGYQLYWCATCNVNECEHTRRVKKWREAQL
ncbi:MAG: hypothetical protein M3P26_04500 [Gemmatimonadota bacterium]|nr:hypothetical protein [Gemmatimonadota bacterium]